MFNRPPPFKPSVAPQDQCANQGSLATDLAGEISRSFIFDFCAQEGEVPKKARNIHHESMKYENEGMYIYICIYIL